MNNSCKACKHSLESGADYDVNGVILQCRESSPQILPISGGTSYLSVWPKVKPDSWCSKFDKKGKK